MKNYALLLIGLALFVFSCSPKEEDPFLPPNTDNRVDFSNLQEGQLSSFIRYTTKCDDLNDSFEYTQDTLLLEVIKQNGNLFFKEMVTLNSPLYTSGAFVNPVTYPVTASEDNIYIPERSASSLFFFYENDYIYLNPKHDMDLIQEGCRLLQDGQPFIGNDIGAVASFEVGNIKISDKTSISCEPLEDLDAYLIYDNKHLQVSHVIIQEGLIGWSEETVYGWKALEL